MPDPSVSAYHIARPGPDGLCTVAGCGRVRDMHLVHPRICQQAATTRDCPYGHVWHNESPFKPAYHR